MRRALERPVALLVGLMVLDLFVLPTAAQEAPWWEALPRDVYSRLERVDVESDWLEVYRVAPGVTAIYEPGHFEEALAYLIEGDERAVLFDTLLGIGDLKAVVDQLTALDVTVVNSHTHPDHIGGDPQFEEIAVYDSDLTRERLAAGTGSLRRLITAESVWKPLPDGFDPETYAIPPITPTRFLTEGERIDLGGRVLEVLFTPGHTADSICLIDRANRILFTADTIYPATLYAHTRDANFDDYYATAQRLGALEREVDLVCPGHNEARVDPSILGRVARAFEAIRAGRTVSRPERDGVVHHQFEGVEILTRTR